MLYYKKKIKMNTIVDVIGIKLKCLGASDGENIKKQKIKEYKRKYYILNREKVKQQFKKWYLKNREKKLKKSKERYLKNKETYLKQRKEYYLKNEEIGRAHV